MNYWIWGSEYFKIINAYFWMASHISCSIYIPTNSGNKGLLNYDCFTFASITSFYF